MTTERTVRGYMLLASHAYIGKNYDPATSRKIEASIDPRVRDVIAKCDPAGWYPISDVAEIFRAVAHHHEADGQAKTALENIGRSIGESATGSFMKFVFKILSPSLFATKCRDFWARDHKIGTLSCETYEADKKHMVVALRGVKNYDYIGPVAPGFILFALNGLGAKNVRVNYDWSSKAPGGPDEFVYEFHWD